MEGEHGINTQTVARAFSLAPECESLKELRKRLIKEGYSDVHAHLAGTSIQQQLRVRFRCNSFGSSKNVKDLSAK